DKVRIFLDSGAYTAWTKNTEIDLQQYIDYCQENVDIIEVIAVLDQIPDSPASADLTKAIKKTYWNLQEMERRGLKDVVPAYHFLEPEEVLDYYAKNYKYVAIGGLVGKSTKQLLAWLDRMWTRYLLNADGTPKTRVHGFGITSLPAMERYPWF